MQNKEKGRIYNIVADFLESLLLPDQKHKDAIWERFEIASHIRRELLILNENKNKSVRERARHAIYQLEELQRRFI